MSIGVCILYLPGMPSALVWPYEWVIILAWALFGTVLYKISMAKYGAKNANKLMDQEIERVLSEEDIEETSSRKDVNGVLERV